MIPIYRAKKIDKDAWVEGYIAKKVLVGYIIKRDDRYSGIRIDPNTLAIHFPNMIDKNGKKIFASLSEDGVGGDIVRFKHITKLDIATTNTAIVNAIAIFNEYGYAFVDHKQEQRHEPRSGIEVIGVHKGAES